MHRSSACETFLPSPAQRLAERAERVAVTGATGWFGRVALDLLAQALGPAEFRARVAGYASSVRSVHVAGVGPVALRPLEEVEPAELLLHFAFVTRPHVAAHERDRFIAANIAITSRVLDVIATGDVRGVFVTSSGAARDPNLVSNPYGALKRLDELAFPAACRETQAPCVMARVFNVGGAHISRPESYALGDLILRARDGRPLEIASPGDVVRSYVAVQDIIAVALGELMDGRDASFDTAGERPVEIGELAQIVLRVLGRTELEILRERDGYEAPNIYVGDGERLRELASRHGVALQDLDAVVAATAAGLP